jgi:hypothetical protein
MPRKYRMQDDSVTVAGQGHPKYSGKSVTVHGEDRLKEEQEPGRYTIEQDHRRIGKSTARDSSSVNPLDPILPVMPNLRTP